MNTDIQTATAEQQNQVVDVIVLAFVRDPTARWFFPDPHQYVTSFGEFVPAFGGKAFDHESAHYSSEFSGGALWLPPGVEPDETALVSIIERTVRTEQRQTAFGIF